MKIFLPIACNLFLFTPIITSYRQLSRRRKKRMIKDKVIISTEVQNLLTNPMVKFCISVTNEDYGIDRAEITVSEMEAIAELFGKQDSLVVKRKGLKDAVSNPKEWLDYAMQIKLILLELKFNIFFFALTYCPKFLYLSK